MQENVTGLGDHLWAAVEAFGGGFALMRAIRDGEKIVDWELLYANDFVRERWLGMLPAPGTRASDDGMHFGLSDMASLQRAALESASTQESAILVDAPSGAAWRRVVCMPVGGDVVASMTHHISDFVDLEAHIAALSQHVLDIVAITDADARIQWVSPAVERVLGHDVHALVGRPAADLIYVEDVDMAMSRFAEIVDDPRLHRDPIEVRVLDARGGPRWFECMGVNQLDNPLLTGLVVSLHDIDARKQGDAALRASEARTRSIVETAGDGIITLDENGVIESFNHAAERMFNTRAVEVIGRPYPELIPDHVADELRRSLTVSGRSSGPTETFGLRPDDTVFPIQISLSSTTVNGSTVYTAIVRDITRQRQIEEQLEHMALHDDLTGLPNRRALVERLRSMVSRPASTAGHVVGLLCIDLDAFKLVNDSLGHDVGDRLLARVAQRIAGTLEPGDVLGRPNGDEFIVLCDLRRSVDSFVRLANEISDQLRAPFEIDRHEVFVTASIGIAMSRGGETSVELLRNADTAMHRAKQRGRGHVEVFDQAMRIELTARLGIESALQRALERDELRAVYQPIIHLGTGEVVKHEALVRWLRPDAGLLPPADFISVAEDTGLIIPIGEWMLTRATSDAVAWQSTHPGVGVSVNVSGRQLDRTDFPAAVANALRVSQLPPHLLTLEFTESVLIRDADRMVAAFEELRLLGVRLSIDDFGTGYSSLMYLHRLPLDELKIDASFIKTLDVSDEQHPLVAMMVQLGEALGLVTVAEGIDSAAKAAVMRELGSTCGQGFHFARPAPLEL